MQGVLFLDGRHEKRKVYPVLLDDCMGWAWVFLIGENGLLLWEGDEIVPYA